MLGLSRAGEKAILLEARGFFMRTLKFWLLYGISVFFIFATCLCMLLLLCTASMWLRESLTIEEAAPLTGQHVETRDSKIFVFEAGRFDRQPVVFINGEWSWGGLWSMTADPVTENHFRSITLDMPPFGYSQRLRDPDSYLTSLQAVRILDVLEKLEAKKPVIVCHSAGCRPAMEAALMKPRLFDKLVLVCPILGLSGDRKNPRFDDTELEGFWRTLFKMKQLRNSALASYGANDFSIQSIMRAMVAKPEAISAGRLDLFTAPLRIEYTTQAYGDWLENFIFASKNAHVSNFSNFRRLRMPVLIIWGGKDIVTPLWQGEALQKMLPNAQLKVMPDVGHIPYIEDINVFNKTLLNFLHGKPLDAR